MNHNKYEIYGMYLSFEKDIKGIEEEIKKIPTQTNAGHSKIGYMSEELRSLKGDLMKVVEKHKKYIQEEKEKL